MDRPSSFTTNLDKSENGKRKHAEILTPEEMTEKIAALTSQLAEANGKVERLLTMNMVLQESELILLFIFNLGVFLIFKLLFKISFISLRCFVFRYCTLFLSI